MRFSDLLTMSVNNLFRRKLRTFLTVLGVVIGTASIVVMVSIGIGLKEFTIKQYSSYGSLTAIQVYNYDNGNSSDKKNPEDSFMTDETMKTFEKIPHVTSAYPDLNLNVIMRQGVYEGNVQLHGIPLGAMKNIKLGEGSLPTAETKDMEMVVGNMVAQNFSNAKTGKGYWDTGEMPDIDFINKPMFTIFDTDAYYQSKGNSSGEDGSQKVAAPKKYMMKTAGMVAGGPEDWSDYSYGVYVDLNKLKTQLKQIFKKKPIPGQPTNKKGKPYNYFVYEEATVNVDDMDHVIEVQKAISNMGYEANSQMEWLEQDPCIFDLGNWILRTALTDVQKLRKETEGFFVNVNVAAAQLERREFRSAVMNILKETGAKPEELCLELTERCRDLDIHFLRGEVEFFHSQGIKIALDDFGTGNSSLSLALELPFDELKVDMSFIRDIKQKPQNQAMVQSIVDYARRTNTETCIEGIEDKEVSDYIEKFGSTWQQGYYYSKPVPIEQFEEVLREKATEKE